MTVRDGAFAALSALAPSMFRPYHFSATVAPWARAANLRTRRAALLEKSKQSSQGAESRPGMCS